MRWLCGLALACSLVALSVSVGVWWTADDRAEAALRCREKALVDKYRPAVETICRDFDIPGPDQNSDTLDELAEPLHKLLAVLTKYGLASVPTATPLK